jgi:hypothetical protein
VVCLLSDWLDFRLPDVTPCWLVSFMAGFLPAWLACLLYGYMVGCLGFWLANFLFGWVSGCLGCLPHLLFCAYSVINRCAVKSVTYLHLVPGFVLHPHCVVCNEAWRQFMCGLPFERLYLFTANCDKMPFPVIMTMWSLPMHTIIWDLSDFRLGRRIW